MRIKLNTRIARVPARRRKFKGREHVHTYVDAGSAERRSEPRAATSPSEAAVGAVVRDARKRVKREDVSVKLPSNSSLV